MPNELLESAMKVQSQLAKGIILPGEAFAKVIELIAGQPVDVESEEVSVPTCSEPEGNERVDGGLEMTLHDFALQEIGECPYCGITMAQVEADEEPTTDGLPLNPPARTAADFDPSDNEPPEGHDYPDWKRNPEHAVVDRREEERELEDDIKGMPTRAVVLNDIAGAIRQSFPLEALMLKNMASGMEREDSGHVLFNRRRTVAR